MISFENDDDELSRREIAAGRTATQKRPGVAGGWQRNAISFPGRRVSVLSSTWNADAGERNDAIYNGRTSIS